MHQSRAVHVDVHRSEVMSVRERRSVGACVDLEESELQAASHNIFGSERQ